ncbi:hypothetical protein [Diaphorobacter aerolatus]|uniref:Uncharacterized protein n=1 Tax=Diaphorobacter aerolatus TaxID=1288495 RepID=A0A7H0GJB5_9BURK|nr:hypothetical protein [Diaphorobacter aerolatus]QNP48381.1 hypothetical protein H9K75_20900 [Diaphorobacter aerolatus]
MSEDLRRQQIAIGHDLHLLRGKREDVFLDYLQEVNDYLSAYFLAVCYIKREWQDNDTPKGIPPRYFFRLEHDYETLCVVEYKDLHDPVTEFHALVDFLHKHDFEISSITVKADLEKSLPTQTTTTKKVKI